MMMRCVPPLMNVCSDYDECGLGVACENGVCVNTAGSFNCFCSPPLVLDATRRRCVSTNNTEGTSDPERNTMNYTLIAIEGFRVYIHFSPFTTTQMPW